MLKKIYAELVLIRKELQAIRSSEEPKRRAHKYRSKVVKANDGLKRVALP